MAGAPFRAGKDTPAWIVETIVLARLRAAPARRLWASPRRIVLQSHGDAVLGLRRLGVEHEALDNVGSDAALASRSKRRECRVERLRRDLAPREAAEPQTLQVELHRDEGASPRPHARDNNLYGLG
jgi:hypothetical protein